MSRHGQSLCLCACEVCRKAQADRDATGNSSISALDYFKSRPSPVPFDTSITGTTSGNSLCTTVIGFAGTAATSLERMFNEEEINDAALLCFTSELLEKILEANGVEMEPHAVILNCVRQHKAEKATACPGY